MVSKEERAQWRKSFGKTDVSSGSVAKRLFIILEGWMARALDALDEADARIAELEAEIALTARCAEEVRERQDMSKKYTYATTLVNGLGIPRSNDDTERYTPVEPPGEGWKMCGTTVIPCGALLWFWRRKRPTQKEKGTR